MLPPETIDTVLQRLGLADRPAPDADGLALVYRAWCTSVPFDNVVKRIHLASRSTAPIPNGTPTGFFAAFLRHGTGGTCWPSSAGLHALLVGLGFDARRGSAAMRDDLSGPIHTHATVLVRLDGADLWVDSSMLTEAPIPLARGTETGLDGPRDPVRVEPVGDLWRVWWEQPTNGEPIGCLLLDDDVTEAHYLARYEASRDLSPFNDALFATKVFGPAKITLAFGRRFEKQVGGVTSVALGDAYTSTLVDELGYSEEIVAALPPDSPTPVPSA